MIIENKLTIKLPKNLINKTVKELVYGFLFRAVKVDYISHDKMEIVIGDGERVDYVGESVYSVTEKGAYIGGKDEKSLLTALFMLLSEAKAEDLQNKKLRIEIPVGVKQLDSGIERRMLHLCVFPKVPFSSYQKMIRLIGVLGFTHIVLEFWGTLKYDALKELSWRKESFSKNKIKKLLTVIRELKIEPIPMINHFGHASASRVAMGKHVVLDKNPRLSYLFSYDGWCWAFEKPEVRALLKKMRAELYDLFGEGEYFHLGFDESFTYPKDDKSTTAMCEYIKSVCEEVVNERRTPLLWGDLFLHEPTVGIGKEMGYEGNCPSLEISEKMFNNLPKSAVICDWQYFVKESPWKSAEYFKKKGANTIICPSWDDEGFRSGIKTAKELKTYALMFTTWHYPFFQGTVGSLILFYYTIYDNLHKTEFKISGATNYATLLRKIWFSNGDYEKSGWRIRDIDNYLSK